ncbi:MAG: MMPL family transporter, partial [Acidimicrobiales bacterium]
MTAFFAALGRFSVRFRVLIVVAWLIGTGAAVTSLPSLATVTKDTTSGFLPASTPSVVAANMAKPFQSTSLAGLTMVASRSNGPLTNLDQNAITLIEHRVSSVAKVRSVRDLGVSRDGQARLALVQADVPRFGGSAKGSGEKLVTQIRSLFRHVPLPAGLALNLTGQLPTAIDLNASQGKSRNHTQVFSFVFIILLLLVAYRALLAPLVTLFPAAVALAVSGPVIAQATHIGVQVSSITQFMLIVLILGAGTDYGVFLVFRVREELQNGLMPHDAVARAMARVGESITFSALTVMAALVSLVLARFGIYKSLGPSLAIGIAVMLLAGLTLLPAILALLGRAVFWPSRVRHMPVPKTSLYGRLIDPVVRRPVATLAAGVIGFVALAFGLVGTGTAGFSDTTTGPPGS